MEPKYEVVVKRQNYSSRMPCRNITDVVSFIRYLLRELTAKKGSIQLTINRN